MHQCSRAAPSGLIGQLHPAPDEATRGGVWLDRISLPELRHQGLAEMLFGLHQIVALAEQADVLDGWFAPESDLEIVIEFEPMRRATIPPVPHPPGAAPVVALPDCALDGSGDVTIVFAGCLRLRTRPIGQRLTLSIPLEDELERVAQVVLEVPVRALVRERGAYLLQLGHERCRDRDVEAAELRRERLDYLGRRRRPVWSPA